MKIIVISLLMLMFPFARYVNAQRTLSAVSEHFDSICGNCAASELNQMLLKAITQQDSLILQKRRLLLLRLKSRHNSKDDGLLIFSGFDKLVKIGNQQKRDVISVFKTLYSGSLLSTTAGIIIYYFNQETIGLLQFYIEDNTQ